MKKKMIQKISMLTLFFICFASSILFAKSEKKDGFELPNGFRFGYQYSNLINNGNMAYAHLDRGYLGYTRKIKVVPLVHIETGMEAMISGAKLANNSSVELYYLNVPVQGILKLGPVVGIAGFNGNFKLAETQKINGQKVKLDNSNRSSFFDLTLDAGLGFNVLMLTFEGRYYWGLLDVNNGYTNRFWQAGVKIHF